jgi:hypothetical protein
MQMTHYNITCALVGGAGNIIKMWSPLSYPGKNAPSGEIEVCLEAREEPQIRSLAHS